MAVYTLENELLVVKIRDHGAELHSIYHKKTKLEYLWQAGPEWPKQAPVLFPVVGQLKDNTYSWQDKKYKLERHGFARNKIFKCTEEERDSIRFILTEDSETLQHFPFPFQLSIQYRISSAELTVSYEVTNTGKTTMPFSIGAHPAFKVPLHENEKYDDYVLLFEKKEILERHLLQNGLLNGRKKLQLNNEDQISLSHALFIEDALVFKKMKSEKITITSNQARRGASGITMRFSNFPYFGIWAAKGADFVCLEPWHGIADHLDHDQLIENKEGIMLLDAGKKFHCSYGIEAH